MKVSCDEFPYFFKDVFVTAIVADRSEYFSFSQTVALSFPDIIHYIVISGSCIC